MDKRKENKYLPLSEFQTSAQLQRCEKTENFQTFHTRKMQADGKNKGRDKDKDRDIDKDKDKDKDKEKTIMQAEDHTTNKYACSRHQCIEKG